MTSPIRPPAVAGRFYPDRPQELLRDIREYIAQPQTAPAAGRALAAEPSCISAFGCVVPHAGYIYSGRIAGAVFSRIEIPEHCVILCPNHTGFGVRLATMAATRWKTPLGEVAPSITFASQLIGSFPLLEEDSAAHRAEHAIEVQLPFLQVRQANLHIVPIAVGTSDFGVLCGLGEALANGIAASPDRPLIIASSDMNHYESDAITRVKDRKAIERVLALDAAGLFEVVMREKISMCGFGPAIVMLTAAQKLGATSATLIDYATSADVSGDFARVVGYAGIVVE
ncbi:MAG: AmmeMemoRadiSam system protein B [Terriglobales bacterium]